MEKTIFCPALALLAGSTGGEAERMARGIEERLGIPCDRHREFVRDMTANLLRKMDQKTQNAIWRKLIRRTTEDYRPSHEGLTDTAVRPAI